MKRNYAIFIADYTIWNSPSLINLLNLLRNEGELSIFITNTFNRNIDFLKSNRYRFYIIEKIPFAFSLKNIYYQLRSLYYFAKFKLMTQKIDVNFSIDVKGFCQFLVLGNKESPLIYYSLELQLLNDEDPDQLLTFLKPYQKLERKNISFISALIIQSERRKMVFYGDYQLPMELPAFILPVTYNGNANKEKKNYIREKYAIASDKKIALYMGGIQPYYKVKEIVMEMAKSVKTVLFLHGYYESKYITEIKELVIRNNYSNIIFSNEIFDKIEDTDIIYQSADLGIAWYEYASQNFKTAAWSSGKISGYFRFGLPVILNADSGGQEVVGDKNCGVAIKESRELLAAIDTIFANHEHMVQACYQEFEEKYRFINYQKELIQFVESI